MAEKKKPERRNPFDTAAAKYLNRQVNQPAPEPSPAPTETETPAAESAPQKKSRKKKRDRSWDASRSKATYDLPPDLIERVKAVAEELGGQGVSVRVSDVARLLIETGLDAYESGQIDIDLKPAKFKLFDD